MEEKNENIKEMSFTEGKYKGDQQLPKKEG